jgi:arginine Nomega-methyltransferase
MLRGLARFLPNAEYVTKGTVVNLWDSSHRSSRHNSDADALIESHGDMEQRFLLASMQAALNSTQQSMDSLRAMLATGKTGSDFDDAVISAGIRSVPRWHFSMLNDLERNEAFLVALERVLPQGAHVLDIGSGTGLLAMMAAKAGAASVTTCESNPILAELARQIIAQHGLSDVITVVPKRSDHLVVGVDLLQRADLIIFEIVDCGLIGEDVLPTVAHARAHLLAPGGTLLPESARVFGALLDSTVVDGLNRVGFAAGFDVGLLNRLATQGHFPVRLPTWPHRLISRTYELGSFDFVSGSLEDGSRLVELVATESGTAHGLVAWFEMSLGNGIMLCNSPDNPASHWMQAFVQFVQPVMLTEGEKVRIEFSWQRDRFTVREINVLTMTEGSQ